MSDAPIPAVGNVVDLQEGQVLLPSFVLRRADGLWVDISALDSPALFPQFVERVFSSGARFQQLDYALFSDLLYHWEPQHVAARLEEFERHGKPPQMRLAADIVPFPEARRAIYRGAKVIDDGAAAEYLFEPVIVEREVQEPVFGEPDADGNAPMVMEVHTFSEQLFLDLDEFIADLWVKGIRYGIDVAAVRDVIEHNRVERLVVAKKLAPKDGSDASIDEQTDALHRSDVPAIRSDGRMDLCHFRNRFPQVAADTRLFKKVPRISGVSGWDVQGKEIPPTIVKDFDINTLAGPGTRVVREDHADYVVSTIEGFLNIDTQSGQISVLEKIVNKEGVSMRTTGDLALAGDEYEEHGEVQEKRVVEGHHMTFMSNVFGRVHSDGGRIVLKANINGGEAISAGGSVTVEGNAVQAQIDARGGEAVLALAENCTIFGTRVRIERAVRCTVVADSVEIGVCEGSAVAAKNVSIQASTSRRDEPSVVVMLLPDLSPFDRELASLDDASEETKGEIAERKTEIDTLADSPDLKSYLALLSRVKAGALVIDATHEAGWKKLQERAVPSLRQFSALKAKNIAAEKLLAEWAAERPGIEAARRDADTGIHCAIAEVRGDTQVRWLRRPYDEAPLPNLSAREIQLCLRNAGEVEERIFSGAVGSVDWPASEAEAIASTADAPLADAEVEALSITQNPSSP
jgi:uncharacterized protein